MSIKRTYIVKENIYDTILRITVQCFDSEPVITVDRFKIKNAYGDKLLDAVVNKLDTPLLIDVTTNPRITYMLTEAPLYIETEDELKI